jgi:hypothetical protein
MRTWIAVMSCITMAVVLTYGVQWFRYGTYWTVWRGKRARHRRMREDRRIARKR